MSFYQTQELDNVEVVQIEKDMSEGRKAINMKSLPICQSYMRVSLYGFTFLLPLFSS